MKNAYTGDFIPLYGVDEVSAVGATVSAGYGFLCGAYMPISQFDAGPQKALTFLPGTYGMSLSRNHALAEPCGS